MFVFHSLRAGICFDLFGKVFWSKIPCGALFPAASCFLELHCRYRCWDRIGSRRDARPRGGDLYVCVYYAVVLLGSEGVRLARDCV